MTRRAFRVRVSPEQAHELQALAAVDGVSVSDEIGEAVTALLAAKLADPDVGRRLRERIEHPVAS
jgi:hypothetical protein